MMMSIADPPQFPFEVGSILRPSPKYARAYGLERNTATPFYFDAFQMLLVLSGWSSVQDGVFKTAAILPSIYSKQGSWYFTLLDDAGRTLYVPVTFHDPIDYTIWVKRTFELITTPK